MKFARKPRIFHLHVLERVFDDVCVCLCLDCLIKIGLLRKRNVEDADIGEHLANLRKYK
jgi:hypothetical protein